MDNELRLTFTISDLFDFKLKIENEVYGIKIESEFINDIFHVQIKKFIINSRLRFNRYRYQTIFEFNIQPSIEQIEFLKSNLTIRINDLPTSLVNLDLSNNKLTNIEFVNSSQIQILISNNNLITNINLSKLPSLRKLFLVKNNLSKIDIVSNSLTNLILNDNLITDIGLSSLPSSLTSLKITENNISKIDLESIHPNIVKINLRGNKFKNQTRFVTSNIKKLYLDYCYLSNVEIISDSVIRLRLGGNYISDLGSCVLPKVLEFLDLSENDIEQVDFDQLPKSLIDLNIAFNKLTEIKIHDFPKLKNISLFLNKITKSELYNLGDLKNLDLSNNKLTELDLSNINYIDTLDLNDNLFHDIKSIKFPKQLIYLELDDNKITEINEGLFPSTLISFSINRNKLSKISKRSFPEKINYVSIIGNQVNSISDDFFVNLIKFYYDGNPMNDIRSKNIIKRFENRKLEIYHSQQNIHSSRLQQSLINSIDQIIERNQIPSDFIINYQNDNILSDRAKKEINDRFQYHEIHSILNLKYSDLFRYIWFLSHSNDEIKKRLDEEITEGIGLCFTGAMTRLVNSLSGFYDYVILELSNNERRNGIFYQYYVKNIGLELNELVSKIANETEYSEIEIREYFKHITSD